MQDDYHTDLEVLRALAGTCDVEEGDTVCPDLEEIARGEETLELKMQTFRAELVANICEHTNHA